MNGKALLMPHSPAFRSCRWLPVLIIGMAFLSVIVGWLALRAVETRLLESAGEHVALAASSVAAKLELLLAERSGDLHLMAQAPVFHGQDRSAMTAYLKALQESYPVYSWLGITNAQGRVIAATDAATVGLDRSQAPWFEHVRRSRRIHAQDATASVESRGMLAVSFTAPILSEAGEFRGVVTALVGLPILEDVLAQTVNALRAQRETPEVLEYQLVASDGTLLADSVLRQEGQVNLKALGVPSASLLDARPSGYVEETHWRRGVRVLTGYARTRGVPEFPGLSWGILVRVDRNDLLAPIRTVIWKVTLAAFIVFVPLHGLLLWTTNHLQAERDQAQLERIRARQAEEEQRRLTETVHLLLESTKGGIYGQDRDGRCTFINRAGAAMLGYEPGELLGQRLHGLIHQRRPDGSPYPAEECPILRVLTSGEAARIDTDVFWRKDGTSFLAGYSCAPIRQGREIRGTVVTFADITERKQAEEALREAKERAERVARDKARILAAVKAFFIGLDDNGIVIEWTPAAERVLGLQTISVLGRPFASLPIEWCWDTINGAIDQCRRTLRGVTLDNIPVQVPDRPGAVVKLTVVSVLDDLSIGVVIMGEDVTERLHLEREMANAQKWEAIGQLAAGIAHEINTPTQYIGDNLRFLRDAFGDLSGLLERYAALRTSARMGMPLTEQLDEIDTASAQMDLGYVIKEIPSAIQQALEGTERVTTIVRAMKDFAYPDSGEKTLVDLNKAIQSTVTVSRNEWKYVANLLTDLDPELPPVLCLAGPFNQVILNLIVNAAHAIAEVVKHGNGEKGTITVSSRRVDDWVEIRVSDTGTGIPEAIRGKIFDPFFTTKEVGKGTGQGLAIARSVVVDKHGGTIRFETEVGKGTTFIIRLPLLSASSAHAGPKAIPDAADAVRG